jgi:hypothetical protein
MTMPPEYVRCDGSLGRRRLSRVHSTEDRDRIEEEM